MLLGVAGGMARYLDVDPSLVRIVWALLVIAGGAGILLYIIAAIVIPEEPEGGTAASSDPSGASGTGAGGPGAAPPSAGASSAGPGSGSAWSYRAGVERRDRGGGAVLIGIVLVLIGGWLLLQRFIPQLDADLVWPVALLLLGGALVIGAMRR